MAEYKEDSHMIQDKVRTTHNGDGRPVDIAKRLNPQLFFSAPRWVFSKEAFEDIFNYWDITPDDEKQAIVGRLKFPYELVVEFHDYCVVFCRDDSPNFTRIAQSRAYDRAELGKEERQVAVAAYASSELVERFKADGKHDWSEKMAAMAQILFAVRSTFTERYVERTAAPRKIKPKFASKAPIHEIVVKWDAPKPRYSPQPRDSSTEPPESRGPTCQHEVREFLRVMKSGKVVYVRPHLRGDPTVPRKTVTKISGGDK